MTAIRKLEQLPPLPNFNLPSPYDADYWDFKNWDYYKNSSEKYKKEWNLRGNTYKDGIDFTDCQNKWIREEIKFFLFTSITVNNNNLYTFSNHYDKLKPLIRFINTELSGYYSLTEIQDLSAYEVFLSEKQGIALKTN